MASGGFACTAFMIDASVNGVLGWECSTLKETAFVETAIRHAAAARAGEGHPVAAGGVEGGELGVRILTVPARAGMTARKNATQWPRNTALPPRRARKSARRGRENA